MVTKRRISRFERAKELQLMHAAGDDAWWGRPDTDTVNAVWRLVAPMLPDNLRHLITDFTGRQVLAVLLARCIQVGEEGQPEDRGRSKRAKRNRKRRRTFSQNHLFDAVAPKWSRTFKTIAEDGRPGLVPTRNIFAFRHDDALEVRRQLLAVGVRLADVWKIIAGGWSNSDRSKQPGTNPFFYLTRPDPKLGYRVHLRDTAQLAELRRLLPPAHGRERQLLLDTDPWPSRVDRYKVCAERPFNGVEEDDKAVLQVLEILERTRLLFHVRTFAADYDRWARIVEHIKKWKARVPYDRRAPFARRVKHARGLQIDLDAYRQVRGQADGLPDHVLIKSQFFRDQEGRFHARHFWPARVSGRREHKRRPRVQFLRDARFSHRTTWFTDRDGRPLAGYDIASSQTQILAILLGLTDLEALTRRPGFKVYAYLAEQAVARRLPLRPGTGPAELARVMKDLWVRILYGGHLREIVRDHDALVPGAFKRKFTKKNLTKRYNAAIKTAERNLRALLESVPWYGKPGEGKLSDFFRASEAAARTAMAKDLYAGVTFTDPFAGTTIRWNPPRRGRWRMNCSGLQVVLKLPGGWAGKKGTAKRRFIDAAEHPVTGDYPVSAQKLKQAVAPGVVHLMDAFFNALVIQALDRDGIRDFVALHDSWLMAVRRAAPGEQLRGAFRGAITNAGQAWLEGLGPIYAGLADYLKGTEFEPWICRLQARWKRRVRAQQWPDFRVEPAPWMTLPSG